MNFAKSSNLNFLFFTGQICSVADETFSSNATSPNLLKNSSLILYIKESFDFENSLPNFSMKEINSFPSTAAFAITSGLIVGSIRVFLHSLIMSFGCLASTGIPKS